MTEIILGKRNSGKTTELIKRSAKDGIYILTNTSAQARLIFDQAKRMGYDIPFPVSWNDFTRTAFLGSSIRKDGLLIDQADMLLSRIFGNIPIHAVTWTEGDETND